MAAHQYDLGQYTYIDVKVASPASDVPQRILDSAGITGMEFIGHIGELPDHLLYRIPKTDSTSGRALQSDDTKNQEVVSAISAVRGVVQVELQVPHQRIKRDEL